MSDILATEGSISVSLGGKPLSDVERMHLISVSFKDAMSKLDSADVSFTVPENKALQGRLDLYGKEMLLELKRGGKVIRTFAGDIMSASWKRSGGADRTCTLTAVDALHRCKRGRPDAKESDRKWTGKTITDIVKDVATYWGFGTSKIAGPPVTPSELEWEKDDAALLMELAETHHYTVRVDSPASGKFDLVFVADPNYRNTTVKLKYGFDIYSIDATHSLDGLLKEVTSTGRKSLDDEEPVVHAAAESIIKAKNAKVGVGYLSGFKAFSESIEDETGGRDNQSSVKDRAEARLKEAADSFVSGSLSTRFLPELSSGTLIEVQGAGWPLDGTFAVEEVTHTLDSSGYRSDVTFKSNSIETP